METTTYERIGVPQEKLLLLQGEIGARQREMLRVVAELDSLEAYDGDAATTWPSGSPATSASRTGTAAGGWLRRTRWRRCR